MTLLSVVLKKSEIVIKKKVTMTTVFFKERRTSEVKYRNIIKKLSQLKHPPMAVYSTREYVIYVSDSTNSLKRPETHMSLRR